MLNKEQQESWGKAVKHQWRIAERMMGGRIEARDIWPLLVGMAAGSGAVIELLEKHPEASARSIQELSDVTWLDKLGGQTDV